MQPQRSGEMARPSKPESSGLDSNDVCFMRSIHWESAQIVTLNGVVEMKLSLRELMFCESTSDESALLGEVAAMLAPDLHAWDELSEVQKADLFGKLLAVRQSVDYCLVQNFNVDPAMLPTSLNDMRDTASDDLPDDVPFVQLLPQILATEMR